MTNILSFHKNHIGNITIKEIPVAIDQAILQIVTTNFSLSKKSKKDFRISEKLIPCGVQTLSKMPSKFIEGVYPIYLEMGKGCYVGDNEGNRFIDYAAGLGTNLLGYSFQDVNDAVKKQLDTGTIFILPSILETKLAQKIKQLIPCAEMTRFLKTGSEATSAAIKISRAYTDREHVAFCGYHGWHDWFTVNTPKNKGIPKCYADLTHKFLYNDIQSLVEISKKYPLAAIIIEPCIFEEPKDNFLKKVKDIARKNGAVLIFDEVVTGFRTPKFSAQKFFGITPDLATFGKACANGVPISFVCGKSKIMKELEGDCFVSSTFGGDLIGISAALETIKIIENYNVLDHIWYFGEYLKDGYNEIAEHLDINTSCKGYPNRTMFDFPTSIHKSLFWQECIKRGVLFGYANFVSFSHNEREIIYTLEVIREALKIVKKHWDKPRKALEGKPATEVFRLIAEKK
jgi:glutamate-1-semialdehyde aminotransferase